MKLLEETKEKIFWELGIGSFVRIQKAWTKKEIRWKLDLIRKKNFSFQKDTQHLKSLGILGGRSFHLLTRGLGPGGSWMAAWVGAGGPEDQQGDWRVGTFNPTVSPACQTGKGMGAGAEFVISSQWFDQSCLGLHRNPTRLGSETFQVGEHLEMLWGWWSGESMDAPHPFPTPLPEGLFHLAVPKLYPFIMNSWSSKEAAFQSSESCSSRPWNPRRGSNLYPWDNLDSWVGSEVRPVLYGALTCRTHPVSRQTVWVSKRIGHQPLPEDRGGGGPTHLVSDVKSNVAGKEKQRLFSFNMDATESHICRWVGEQSWSHTPEHELAVKKN